MLSMHRNMRIALLLGVCIVTGSGQGLPQPARPAFPALPKPGANAAGFQTLAPSSADAAGAAPSSEEVQYPALAPAPVGTGQPYIGQQPLRPNGAPQPAPGPLSPYNPIFNPIIGRVDPNTQSSTGLQAQSFGSTQYQTVTANNNGQVTTTPNTYTGSNGYSNTNSNSAGYSSNTQQSGNQASTTYGQGGTGTYNTDQGASTTGYGTQTAQTGYQNGQTSQTGYQTFSAPAPAPVAIGETNAMVQRVDTAFAKAQKTPQLSFGQDGVTVQQPVVNNPDGIVSGGNQFKVNEHGVILGNVGTGGSINMQNNGGVTIDPGTAGNLWNLARSAAQLYGRRLQEHTETE